MKKLVRAELILGMEIDHNKSIKTLTMIQTSYIDDVDGRLGQRVSKGVDKPYASGLKLSSAQSPTTEEGQLVMYALEAVSLLD
ncbi:hypothetical protein Plhal304r1_c101g0175111 [Plasmopara halstedii]